MYVGYQASEVMQAKLGTVNHEHFVVRMFWDRWSCKADHQTTSWKMLPTFPHTQSLHLKESLEMLVVDEADLVFSYGYEDDVKAVLK